MTFQDGPAAQIALAEAAARDAVPPASEPRRAVRFTGGTGAFWRLQLRGALLLAATLGIYRFWFATDVRRFLWSHTEVAGEPLEYSGTAMELLIGFLIAIALLVPINLAFFVLALVMGTVGEFVGVLTVPVLFVLGQFAFYRARRYRLTRTVLRGVRFNQVGSGIRYAICATFWWVLIVLTIGLAYPFAQASLERYKMQRTFYGDLGGRFDGSGFRLFLRGFPMWLLVMAPLVIGVLLLIVAVDWDVLGEAISKGSAAQLMELASVQVAMFIAFAGITLSVAFAALLYPVFQAMVLRWWLSGIRFGELTVTSHLLKRRIYAAYLRFMGYALLFSLVAAVAGFIALLMWGAIAASLGGLSEIAGVFALVACYVIVMLGYSAIYQATVRLALWRHSMDTLDLQNLAVLDAVKATGRPGSPIGEGMADALNVGGI